MLLNNNEEFFNRITANKDEDTREYEDDLLELYRAKEEEEWLQELQEMYEKEYNEVGC